MKSRIGMATSAVSGSRLVKGPLLDEGPHPHFGVIRIGATLGLRNLTTAVRPPGLPGLPIPTTLMLDAEGVVRWKDQSKDYMQRSNPDYVRAALAEYF